MARSSWSPDRAGAIEPRSCPCCNGGVAAVHLRDVSLSQTRRQVALGSSGPEFSVVYRENVGAVTAFFARRCREPQEVADLTSQTFVEAIASAHRYESRGSPRAWLIAIARTVYARHRADEAAGNGLVARLGGELTLDPDEVEDLLDRIDAQSRGRELLVRAAQLPELERAALELVDLVGLSPKDAARALQVSAGALRVRLFRARSRLRKDERNERI